MANGRLVAPLMLAMLAALAAFPQNPNSSAAPDAAQLDLALALVREYAVNYTQRLPDYTCTRISQRELEPTQFDRPGAAPHKDVVEEQLSFVGHRESYQVTAIDGKSVTGVAPHALGGTSSFGEFGSLLYRIFDPATHADLRWERWATLAGRSMYVFAFRVPQSKGYLIRDAQRAVVAGFRGLVYADAETKAVMRIQVERMDLPPGFGLSEVKLLLDYKPTQVAGREFILPSHFELHSREAGYRAVNQADFKLYRRYGSEARITFQGQ